MKVTYISNNSGGDWWLKDEDWFALEKAGWQVEWYKNENSSALLGGDGVRYLGALAKRASKDFNVVKEALEEFERITSQDVMEEGCNCCGAPHAFRWDDEDEWHYASGDELAEYLYGDIGALSKRELLERQKAVDKQTRT